MDRAQAARRITNTLFAAQSLGSAATVAIFPIAAIAGAKLSGRPSWAGVPSGAVLLGQALSAFAWGHLMDRLGRRGALMLGMLIGIAGAALASDGIVTRSFGAFLLGSACIGAAVSAVQLARFVSAEVHPPSERARAISNVVLGGTVGAIFGPLLASPMAALAARAGFDELAGPYGATAALYVLGIAVVYVWLHPEPKTLSRMIASECVQRAETAGVIRSSRVRSIGEIVRTPGAFVAMSAMIFGQLVMSMLMVITPLHMKGHDHPLASISFVISAHVVGMYAFSIFSGRLADRWGRGPVIVSGGIVLMLACLSATLSPQVLPLSAALFLLGLGWNFCYVGGSSLLSDQLSPEERARTQGFNDLLIGLAAALGSLSSGVAFATIGYGAMGLVGAGVALIPMSLAAWWRVRAGAAPMILTP